MQPIDVNVDIDEALNVDIQLAAPISVPITLAPDVIISVDVAAVGPAGIGIPMGGLDGQVLAKASNTSYDTEWVDQSGGGGAVDSVNGQTGVVVLTAANVGAPAGSGTSTGTNTGDQDLSGLVPNTRTVNTKPLSSNVVLNQDDVLDGTTYKQYSQTEKTKLAAITGTNTGDQTTITGNAGSATILQTARTIGTLTGDVTSAGSSFNGSANNTNATVLATVNSNVGSFGSASSVAVQTVNAKGLTTAASSVAIQIAESQVTNLVSDLAAKQGTLTLTTVGTSGAATLIANTLNIPNYAGGGGSAGITRSISNISTNTTAGAVSLVDYVYFVSSGATLTLPTAVGNTNAYEVTNPGVTNITVNTTSSQTINGNLSMLISPNSSRKFYSDTANWRVF